MSTENSTPERRRRLLFGFPAGGIVLVILVLGALLAALGGKVKVPVFATNASGESQRVFITAGIADRIPPPPRSTVQ
mgnify:CR=1 FL=1